MKLYHSTPTKNIPSILQTGLMPKYPVLGIVYLAPTLETAYKAAGQTILEVETDDLRLTAFDDCRDWEVFCWGHIPPKNIKVLFSISEEAIERDG